MHWSLVTGHCRLSRSQYRAIYPDFTLPKDNANVYLTFLFSGINASSLTRPASPESDLAAIRPLPIEIESAAPEAVVPEIEILPLPEVIVPEVEVIPAEPEVIVPEVEVIPAEPEVIVPEVEVIPVQPEAEEEDVSVIIRPLPEVIPVAPEPEAEACEIESEVPEVIEVPEIEVIVPEVEEVEAEPCAESETAGLVRPLPVEENPSAVAPEVSVLPFPNLIIRNA